LFTQNKHPLNQVTFANEYSSTYFTYTSHEMASTDLLKLILILCEDSPICSSTGLLMSFHKEL